MHPRGSGAAYSPIPRCIYLVIYLFLIFSFFLFFLCLSMLLEDFFNRSLMMYFFVFPMHVNGHSNYTQIFSICWCLSSANSCGRLYTHNGHFDYTHIFSICWSLSSANSCIIHIHSVGTHPAELTLFSSVTPTNLYLTLIYPGKAIENAFSFAVAGSRQHSKTKQVFNSHAVMVVMLPALHCKAALLSICRALSRVKCSNTLDFRLKYFKWNAQMLFLSIMHQVIDDKIVFFFFYNILLKLRTIFLANILNSMFFCHFIDSFLQP